MVSILKIEIRLDFMLLLALSILLPSCVTYQPLAIPFNKSVLSDLAVGDVISMRLHNGMELERIEKFKIQEIQGDSILVGSQIIIKHSGDTPKIIQRNISVSKLNEIHKREYSVGKTIGLVGIIGMIVAIPIILITLHPLDFN